MNQHMDTLADSIRERQAALRRSTWLERELQQPRSAPKEKERLTMRHKFAVALVTAALIAFTVAQAVVAAGSSASSALQRMT